MVHGIIEQDFGSSFCWFLALEVMIKRDRRGHSYCVVRGEILGSTQDELVRKHLPRMFSLITERKLEVRRRSDTALVLTINDANLRSAVALVYERRGGQLPGNQSLWVPGEVWLQS